MGNNVWRNAGTGRRRFSDGILLDFRQWFAYSNTNENKWAYYAVPNNLLEFVVTMEIVSKDKKCRSYYRVFREYGKACAFLKKHGFPSVRDL
jgi:hypothetical protein